MHVDLSRFERHHPETFHAALAELRAGQRSTDWTTYLLPRVGDDEYGIRSVLEAEAYLLDGPLFRDYSELLEVIRDLVVVGRRPLLDVFGTPDDLVVISSLTLTRGVCGRLTGNSFQQMATTCGEVLGAAAVDGYGPCPTALALLGQ